MAWRILLALWLLTCARVLGVRAYGRLSVILAILLTAAAAADAGVPTLLTRRVAAKGVEAEASRLRRALALQGAVAGVAAVVTFIAAAAWAGSTRVAAASAGVAAATTCIGPVGKAVLRATNRVELEGRIQVLAGVGLLLGTAVLLRLEPTVGTFIGLYAFIQTLVCIALLAAAAPRSTWIPKGVTRRDLWDLFREGLPLSVLSTASLIYLRLDVLALGWARPDEDVGRYSAGLQVYQGVWVLGSIVAVVGLPWLVQRYNDAKVPMEWRATVIRLSAWMALLGVGTALALYVGARPAIPLLLGQDFTGAVPVLRILALSLPLVYVNFALGQALIAIESDRAVMLNALLLATLAVVFFPLAARFGSIETVAIVVVILSAVSTLVQAFALKLSRWTAA